MYFVRIYANVQTKTNEDITVKGIDKFKLECIVKIMGTAEEETERRFRPS